METKRYYVSKLRECLTQRQKRSPKYSLRAFSRDIDIHSSTLSQVLSGKRELPFKKASLVAQKLGLSAQEKTLFMESFYRSKTNIDEIEIAQLDERFILDDSHYQIISEWEHYAILTLFNLSDFAVTKESIMDKFELSSNRAQVVLENLTRCNLITPKENGSYTKVHQDLKTTEDISSHALRESHKETLDMGKTKLDEIEIELRDFSSTTIAVDPKKLSEAKTIIREFRQKMTALLRDGHKKDVYQLAIQFYPLTKMEKLQ